MLKILLSSLITLCIALGISSCETYEYVDYKAMEDKEKQMLTDFYASALFDDLAKDSIRSVDGRSADKNTGWYLLVKDNGSGDKVVQGKYVGIRYTSYLMGYKKNATTNIEEVAYIDTSYNYTQIDAYIWQTGLGDMKGLDYSVQQLNKYGKGVVIMSSFFWETVNYYTPSSYTPVVYDFEITYLQK